MSQIQDLQPQAVFHWFYEINQIPRGSGNEKAISDFLVKFAEERGLEVEQDEAMNVIIRKPGTAGYENSPLVTIQGHMDMVCEKGPNSTHNFETDPIEMIVDGEWVRANDTTLGGDDGIAVAFALAVLDSKDIPHPSLEVLITTAEETGMDGAYALKEGQAKGEFLLNLDSDNEGTFLLGCAGGADCFVKFPTEKESVSGAKAYTLQIGGLRGGHSGQMIHEGRGNAIKIGARILHAIKKESPVRLVEVAGGSKHNAIPSQATFTFVADTDIEKIATEAFKNIFGELQVIEPGLEMKLDETSIDSAMSTKTSTNIIDYLFVVPHGVQSMSPHIEGLVQTSMNAAILSEKDGHVVIQHSLRSAVNSSKEELLDKIFTLAEHFGGEAASYGAYPAWEFNPNSPLKDKVIDLYNQEYGEKPIITAIHAGLECGLLQNVMPETDMISFGPNMEDIHTPRERLNIPSTERVWNFFLKLLASFK